LGLGNCEFTKKQQNIARITPEKAPITVVDRASLWLLSRHMKFKLAAIDEFNDTVELDINGVGVCAEEG
jgi:hypothetical protein